MLSYNARMRKKIEALIREKDGLRGLVPGRSKGADDKAYGEYLKKIDPRNKQDVQVALACTEDVRFQEFLERVQSTKYKNVSMQSIAKACNISLMEFTKWWRKASTQQAIATAQTATIEVVQDMVEDARSTMAVCERCDGMTWISAPPGLPKTTPGYRQIQPPSAPGDPGLWARTCPACVDGRVRKTGDTHSRDKLLEIGGLVQKGKGGVSVVLNLGGADHMSAVPDLEMTGMSDVFDVKKVEDQ